MEIEGVRENRRGRWKSKGYVKIEGVGENRRIKICLNQFKQIPQSGEKFTISY